MDKVLTKSPFEYRGKVHPKPGEQNENGQPLYPYLPDEALVEAVNLAIYLERPLLIKGEPGCGKTRLARAVAYELSLPYEAWHIKSSSKASDGLYTYDSISRLRDVQLATRMTKDQRVAQTHGASDYVRWGPLGRAFVNSQRTIVLIDEIDKADIDFPNDLLLELDEQRFVVEEIGKEVHAKAAPIVFITSNDEKDLPDAFLRRCLFHYIDFPDHERLVHIVNAHFPKVSEGLVNAAVDRFLELREEMYEDKGEAGKKVSTSELIDWFRVLHHYPQDEVLKKLFGQIPYPSVLLKSWDDHRRYLTKMGKNPGTDL